MATTPRRPLLEVRVAVAEERLDNLEEEQLRQRERIHSLESDRALIRLVADQIKDLPVNAERIAKRAANEAIGAYAEHKDEIGRRRWSLRLQWVGSGIAFGGLIASIVYQILH